MLLLFKTSHNRDEKSLREKKKRKKFSFKVQTSVNQYGAPVYIVITLFFG
jgi:hypothetical protein